MNVTEPAVRTVEELASHPNPSAIIGQSVRFTAVPVQQVLNGQYVIIGESAPGVVVRLKERQPDLKPGQRLDITGMVAQLGEDLAHWQLDPQQKEIVGRHLVFINAIQSGPSQNP